MLDQTGQHVLGSLCGGRNDDLDQSGVGVVDQTRHEKPRRKGAPEDIDVDRDRGVRVADGLGVSSVTGISKNSASISG